MAYVSVPKDLTKVKSKVIFNLTKRQLICFGGGALIGLPLFFLLKNPIGASAAAMAMIAIMLPAFLFGMYEKNGQPLEVYLKQVVTTCFLRPKRRLYKTKNLYSVLEEQHKLNSEVKAIAKNNAHKRGQKTDKRACRKAKAGQKGTVGTGQHTLQENVSRRDMSDKR